MPCDIQGILMRLPGMTQDLQQTPAFPERQAGGSIEHLKWHVNTSEQIRQMIQTLLSSLSIFLLSHTLQFYN